jgi:ABC-type oligopeptide transport system substrate-binding subunit
MDALNAKPTQITFGAISYGMDFVDASNMLGIWVSTGRHSWKNEEFDRLVLEAGAIVDDPAKRSQMFKDAEKILVDDVGGVFIAHRWQGDLFQPYVRGDSIRVPDSKGIAGWHFNNLDVISDMYIAKQ